MRNHGQHFALKCGLDHCVGRYVITMDDDLQHPPEEIPKLIAALEADPELDVVSGVYDVKKHSGFRNLGSALNTRLVRAVFRTAPGVTLTSFAIYRRCVVDEVRKTHYARPRIGLIVLSVTSRIGNVTVRHEPRLVGRSQYTLRKLVADTFDSVLNYSVLPLRMMTWFGIGSSFLSFIAGLYYLGRYLAGGVGVPGYTSIILAVLFTGGLTLFCFGMVGEYLERIMKNQTAFSEYHVREEIALPSGAGQVSAGGADPAGREGAA